MRTSLGLAVLLAAATSHAAPHAPDLSLTWDEGEMSLDESMWRITVTVTGAKVHMDRTYSGRNGGSPETEPKSFDGVVKDPKKLADALAALDKIQIKPPPKQPNDQPYSGQESSGCLTRGKATRCTVHRGTDPETAEFKAMLAVKDQLLAGIKDADLPLAP